jgi:hypothetical protein
VAAAGGGNRSVSVRIRNLPQQFDQRHIHLTALGRVSLIYGIG